MTTGEAEAVIKSVETEETTADHMRFLVTQAGPIIWNDGGGPIKGPVQPLESSVAFWAWMIAGRLVMSSFTVKPDDDAASIRLKARAARQLLVAFVQSKFPEPSQFASAAPSPAVVPDGGACPEPLL